MEDGHTLFDYDVRLNDTIQLLVRQSLVLPPSGGGGGSSSSKERDSELSDTDSGCCLGQSESDKSSNSGEAAEAAVETDGKAAEGDEDVWDDTELGLYKVRPAPVQGLRAAGLCAPGEHSPQPSAFPGPRCSS